MNTVLDLHTFFFFKQKTCVINWGRGVGFGRRHKKLPGQKGITKDATELHHGKCRISCF